MTDEVCSTCGRVDARGYQCWRVGHLKAPPSSACVWIVTEGCRYEGGEVHSVHATRESALVAVEKLLVKHKADLDGMIQAANDGTSRFSPRLNFDEGWAMQKKADTDKWTSDTDFIEIKEWTVTKEKP